MPAALSTRSLSQAARAIPRGCGPAASNSRHAAVRQLHNHPSRPAQATRHAKAPHDATVAGLPHERTTPPVTVGIDGQSREFDAAFLRDSCTCTLCVDPDSKQKLFQTSDIPEGLKASPGKLQQEDKAPMLELGWENDVPGYGPQHRTKHSIEWLKRAADVQSALFSGARKDERVLWDRERISKDNKWVDFSDYMDKDGTLFEALSHLNNYGLLFLRNVPESEESVVKIAGRIGTLKDTFYGRTWDVKSKPNAKNIAYTHQFLGLHMDLLYTANPPHLQLLHSLRARTPGGESLFSDSFHCAELLRSISAAQFKTLCDFPVTYHYHNDSQHYHCTRPTIELYPSSSIIDRVNWSPPFQGPFEKVIDSNLRSYIAAANAFEKLLSSRENLYEYRLEEGECVIFDNRRTLHARRAFDASKGERWLKGAYVDNDVFFSRLRVLGERFAGRWSSDGIVRETVK